MIFLTEKIAPALKANARYQWCNTMKRIMRNIRRGSDKLFITKILEFIGRSERIRTSDPCLPKTVQRAKLLIFSQRSPVFQALSPIKPAEFRFGRFIEPKITVYMVR